MQILPDLGKTDSKADVSCLQWTVLSGRRKVCVNFKTDTDKLNTVVYRYRNSLYLKNIEVDPKMIEHQTIFAKRLHLLICFDMFFLVVHCTG